MKGPFLDPIFSWMNLCSFKCSFNQISLKFTNYYSSFLMLVKFLWILNYKIKYFYFIYVFFSLSFSSPNLVQHLIQPPTNLPVQQPPMNNMNSMSNINSMSVSPAVSITPVSVPNYSDVSNFLLLLFFFLICNNCIEYLKF